MAKFNSDGKGDWVELSVTNTLIANYTTYVFVDQADVVVNARLAADAVGASKMDRPEWCSTNMANGEVYFALTNNSNRTVNRTVNLSSLTDNQDFSSPDGLVFSPATGIMWAQTDDGAYTDVSNCMMMAALPGSVGDGAKKSLSYTKTDGSALAVDTYVGKVPGADQLKRFLVGPKGCEITGLCETPDGKAMFINIQHPGEGTAQADVADPAKYQSQWPSNAGYGAGKRADRPMHNLQPPIMVFHQCRAALNPVAIVAIQHPVDVADFSAVDVAADHAVVPCTLRRARHRFLEIVHVHHGFFHLGFQVGQPLRALDDAVKLVAVNHPHQLTMVKA